MSDKPKPGSYIDTQGMSGPSDPSAKREPVEYKPAMHQPRRLFTPEYVREMKILINEILDEREYKKKMSDELRDQINDIIEGEIQNGINDYIEQQGKGFKGQELKVNVSQDEVDKIIKEYKKLKKQERSNLSQVKKMGLVDKDGKQL